MREPIINIAIQAARTAGNLIARAATRLDKVNVTEKKPNDYVTNIDKQAEKEITGIISKAYPDHGVLGEEGTEKSGNDYLWIIDPLDGTRNFIHGLPHFAVSIAVKYKNRIEHGVIYDPIRDELFTASRGKGAQLNERRIRVSTRKHLQDCLLGTGFPYRHSPQHQTAYLCTIQALLPICGDIRRLGAATLDLAYVACGRLDGFWELGLKPWDIAAGVLLIKEAGGLITDLHGGDDFFSKGDVIAGNATILRQMLKIIRPHMPVGV
ncbi:MAG: inositol monophosphatase [Gammaproteobacteria bacterium RIFCSPHIGHO2_12_FULL_41_20]|nr:MAG: inositol monophosphatase [Gammaproteobacteria bacterium RIFCSPHIGHO2_12_FULL_41_20]